MTKLIFFLQKKRAFPFILGMGIMLRFIIAHQFPHLLLAEDAQFYHQEGQYLASAKDFLPYWTPALPLYISFIIKILEDSFWALSGGMIAFYVAFSLLLKWKCEKIYSPFAANILALIFAIFPSYLYHSVALLTHLPSALGLLAVFAAFDFDKNEKNIWETLKSIFLGISLGFLILTRPSNVLFLFGLPLFLYFVEKESLFYILKKSLIFVSIPLIMMFLWKYKVKEMNGEWLPMNQFNSINFYFGNNEFTGLYKTWNMELDTNVVKVISKVEKMPEKERAPFLEQKAISHIINAPHLFILRTFNRMCCFFAFETRAGTTILKYEGSKFGYLMYILDIFLYFLLMIGGLIGFFANYLSILQKKKLLCFIFLASIPYFLAFSLPIYHFLILPLMGVAAISWLGKWFKKEISLTEIWISFSRKQQLSFIFLLIFFFFIQIEWILMRAIV